MAARIAIIAMTTRSSMRVKPETANFDRTGALARAREERKKEFMEARSSI
jgi:hypothetical protein